MRLTCPACKAQYEVPIEVIPADGRDVQCSNCSETWFQKRPDATLDTDDAIENEQDIQDEITPADEETDADDEKQNYDEPTEAAEEPAESEEEEPTPSGPPRRELDPAVADLLREEAELEARARRNELSGSIESQPDLGLEDPVPDSWEKRAQQTEARMAVLRGDDPDAPTTSRPSDVPVEIEPQADRANLEETASSRDKLPDIEEINSTLRSNEDRSVTDPGQTAQAEEKEKQSSLRGFTLMISLAALLVVIYAFAPQIAKLAPQTDPWLSAYVAQVDHGRMWLDDHVQNLLMWLDAAAVSSGE